MPGFIGDDVNDVALGEHLARVLRRRAGRFVAQLLARPRQPVPLDLHRTEGLHVGARILLADRHHDRRRQVADRGVLVHQVVVIRLAVRRQVHVSGGPAPAVAAVVLDQSDAHGAIGARLQPPVDGGVDAVACGLGVGAEALAQLETRHLRDVGRLDVIERRVGARLHRLLVGGLGGGGIDVPELAHAPQHVGAAPGSELRIDDRVVTRGRLGNPGDGGGLGHVELVEGLAEEGLGGGGHAVGALAEEDHVQIQPEDLLLGELVLHAVGDESLLQLAPIGLVEVEEHVAGGLHGDGAGALALVTGEQIDEHRAHHAEVIDAVVLEEALVFGGEKRVLDEIGDLVVADRDAALLPDLRDQRTRAGVHAQGHLQLHVAHGIRRGERGDQVHVATGERVGAQKCDQRHTAADEEADAKVIPIHRNQLCLLALPAGAMHSSRRFKGKLTERWGRKASGLRDARAYDSGVAVRTLTYSAASGHARREGGSSDRSGMHLPPAEAKLSVSRTLWTRRRAIR